MTGPIDDEDLTGMLEARAARAHGLPPDEIMRVVRPQLVSGGPSPAARLRQVPLASGWAMAAAAVVVLTVAGILGVGGGVAGPRGTVPPASPTAGASASPDVAASLAAIAATIDREQLLLGLRTGSLEGGIVAITNGELVLPAGGPCVDSRPSCARRSIAGLEGVDVTVDPMLAVEPAATPMGIPVFRVEDGGLVYLGRSVDPLDGTMTVAQAQERTDLGGDAIAAVSGWLVVDGIHPCRRDPSATPCPGPPPWLTDDEPTADGLVVTDGGVRVSWVEPGVRLATQVVTPGPFLVRPAATASVTTCDAASGVECTARLDRPWEVIAHLDSPILSVTLP